MADKNPLGKFEESLGLPAGFIERVGKEGDDWSFTIKGHALLETGLTELLIHRIGHPQLDEMLARLPISGQFSKLSMSKAFQLLGDDGEADRFIEVLGTIRNRLVHNIKRVDFSLPSYFKDLAASNADEFHRQHVALDLLFAKHEWVEVNGVRTTPPELFKANPRLLISSGLGLVLSGIHALTGVARVGKEMRAQADQLFTSMILAELKKKRPQADDAEKNSTPVSQS